MKTPFLRLAVLVVLVFAALSSVLYPDAWAAKKRKRAHPAGPYVISARAALLMEMNSSDKILAKDITRKILPASTTKVLTALLVLEHLDLDAYLTVSHKATMVLPSKIEAVEGDQYQVRDLLYAALLNSANDAAIVLAEGVAGTEANFVKLMNQRAAAIGAHGTLFANAHGLPDDAPQYSTAYDMVLIFREAMKKPFFREVITARFKKIVSKGGKLTLLHSHNKCLFKNWKHDVYGKTGYTREARTCFVGYFERGGKKLLISVFGCSRRWDDIKYIVEHYGGVDL